MVAARDHATKMDLHEVRDDLRGEMSVMRDELRGDIRGVGAVVEQIRSNVAAIAESFGDTARKSDLRAVDERLTARVSLVEDAVRELACDVRANSQDVRGIRNEVAQLRLQLERRDLGVEELERRVREVEKRLGIGS
jgi:predicted trehalose synthase